MGRHDQDELCRCDRYPVAHDPSWHDQPTLEEQRKQR